MGQVDQTGAEAASEASSPAKQGGWRAKFAKKQDDAGDAAVDEQAAAPAPAPKASLLPTRSKARPGTPPPAVVQEAAPAAAPAAEPAADEVCQPAAEEAPQAAEATPAPVEEESK